LQGPMRSREDIAAAIKTYQLVGESIARSDARFEGEVQASFVQSLREAFSKSEEELRAFLRQVGIDPRLLAASVIEESLASNMLFDGEEPRVSNVIVMVWSSFPSCFRPPTQDGRPCPVAPHRRKGTWSRPSTDAWIGNAGAPPPGTRHRRDRPRRADL